MEYYKVMIDITGKNDIVCHFENDYGIQQYELNSGKEYNNWDNRFEFYYDKNEGDTVTDYLANDKGWFLISDKFKMLIESFNIKAQFFPVKIKEINTNKYLLDFYICNIINVVDALCLEESDYFTINTKSKGVINSIKKFAVYKSKLLSVDMFKLGDGHNIPIFISQKFRDELCSQNITGIELLKIKSV